MAKRKSKKNPKFKARSRLPKSAGSRAKAVQQSSGQVRLALNPRFEFFKELRDLILKSSPAEKNEIINKVQKIGRVRLAVISGIFLNKDGVGGEANVSDLFIVVDDLDRRRLRSFLKSLEAEVGKEIKFAVMDKDEFNYRRGMFDRFIRVLFEGPHEKLIDKIGLEET